MDRNLEGWFSDPFALHEARWMSQGTPTALVRDGTVEGHDPAPEGPFKVEPVRLGEDNEENWGDDLRKADDARHEGQFDPNDMSFPAVWAISDQEDRQQ